MANNDCKQSPEDVHLIRTRRRSAVRYDCGCSESSDETFALRCCRFAVEVATSGADLTFVNISN